MTTKKSLKCSRHEKIIYRDEEKAKLAAKEHMERVVFASLIESYFCETHKGHHIGHPKTPYPFAGLLGVRKLKKIIQDPDFNLRLTYVG